MTQPITRPTAAVEELILGYIRAGGYPEVAAEAAGVSRERFARWMRLGRRDGAREPYRSFARHVEQALAQARLKAEIETRQKVPRFWLSSGPGRETSRKRGWTSAVKPRSTAKMPSILRNPQMQRLLAALLAALEPFPEARAAAAEALRAMKDERPRKRPVSRRKPSPKPPPP